jgi:hypothetical protein
MLVAKPGTSNPDSRRGCRRDDARNQGEVRFASRQARVRWVEDESCDQQRKTRKNDQYQRVVSGDLVHNGD